jgi:hypothetical protein
MPRPGIRCSRTVLKAYRTRFSPIFSGYSREQASRLDIATNKGMSSNKCVCSHMDAWEDGDHCGNDSVVTYNGALEIAVAWWMWVVREYHVWEQPYKIANMRILSDVDATMSAYIVTKYRIPLQI